MPTFAVLPFTALAGEYPRRVKTYVLESFGDWTASRRLDNRFQQT